MSTALARGLTTADAALRLARDGANTLARPEPTPVVLRFLAQFRNPMVALLLGACALSAVVGEGVDAIAIGAIVLLNAIVGFAQEYRAERALAALEAMTAPRARVVRDGKPLTVPAADVVAGDLLALDAGDLVAADATVVEAHELHTIEATLTGESLPVAKRADPLPDDTPLAERRDRVFAGTAIATGTGFAVVFATGMRTEVGRIAGLIATADSGETPLQRRLAAVSRTLLYACLGVVAVMAILGFVRGLPWLEILLAAIALAVAAVPEGLPTVVTIALAVGVQRMAARNVLIRRLPAVETLGSVSVVCTDKTGTLTVGHMHVREIWGPDPDGVARAAAACCDAELAADGTWVGDPTEAAILEDAAERGITREEIEDAAPRAQVFPFDSERKRMSILRRDGVLYVKGAADGLLPLCATGTAGADVALARMATRGLRVLGVATGAAPVERDLHFLGLIGLADPPRPEAIAAVREAHAAGIRTVMITGDHPVTATAIAREMGILGPHDDPAEVVHARVTPEDKLRLVRAWKARGAIVAMTGDGVNDAPAIREAHVGIAMGRGGTEVTRAAASIVLADDNFASIIEGIREGRAIYQNIQKTLLYLLAGNAGELLLMLTAAIAGLPLPLLPIHLLWINLVTDGLPALALVMDPPDADVLTRPPRPPDEPMLGRREWTRVATVALLEAGCVLGVFWWALPQSVDLARSLAFGTLVFSELLRAFGSRSRDRVFWEVGPLTNVPLLLVVGVSVLLQVALHLAPPLASLFGILPLTAAQFALAFGLGLVPVTWVEVTKLIRRASR